MLQRFASGTRLSWEAQDPERQLGFPAGPCTEASGLLALLAGAGFSVGFYLLLIPLRATYLAEMFTERGLLPYPIVFFSGWCLAILLVKWRKLACQRQALAVRLQAPDEVGRIGPGQAEDVRAHLTEQVVDPERFLLLERVGRTLDQLHGARNLAEVDHLLRARSDDDWNAMESSYTLVRGFLWAIPVLGFVGTVQGLSAAVGGFGSVLHQAAVLSEVKEALTDVTGGLAVAFETTLVALVATVFIHLLVTFLKRSEEAFLAACDDWCHRHLLARLKLGADGRAL